MARVQLADFRGTGYCPSGIRDWFKAQGFDYRDFVLNGIEAQRLLDTKDVLVEAVARRAIEGQDG